MMKSSELLEQAEAALEAARENLMSRNYKWASGRARNSVEAGLKAVIEYHGKSFTKTNINSLIHELNMIDKMPEEVIIAAKAVADMEPHVTTNEKFCRIIIDHAEVVLRWVMKTMGY
jgi:HEPN domain-containing protein